MSSHSKMKMDKLKLNIIIIYILFIIGMFFIKINGLVFADETYTCKANLELLRLVIQ